MKPNQKKDGLYKITLDISLIEKLNSELFYSKGLLKFIKHKFLFKRYKNKKFLQMAKNYQDYNFIYNDLFKNEDLDHIIGKKCDYLLCQFDHSKHIQKEFNWNFKQFPEWKRLFNALHRFYFINIIISGCTSSDLVLYLAFSSAKKMMDTLVNDKEKFIDYLIKDFENFI